MTTTLYPRLSSGAIEISPNAFVGRGAVDGNDSEAQLRVRPERQSTAGVELTEFLRHGDRYVAIDHRASVKPNLVAAGTELKRAVTGGYEGPFTLSASRGEALLRGVAKGVTAVLHGVAYGLGR